MTTGGTSRARSAYWFSLLLALTSPVLLTGLNLPVHTAQRGVSAQDVGDAQLADEGNAIDWLAYGRTYDGKRFSPIDQISVASISDLKVDWFTELPSNVDLVSTPLVAGGIMYVTDSANIVYALDAKTGKILWTYDARVSEKAGDRMTAAAPAAVYGGRGIALWKARVYLATADGRLVALDAKSGHESWSVNTFSPQEPLHIVGVPIIFHGKVLIGNAGSKDGKTRGYVTAYDAETGVQAWRFYTQRGDAQHDDAQHDDGSAGQPSGEFTYDPEFNTIYISTANGTPVTNAVTKRGRSNGGNDSLSVASIIALDADTGQSRWHYQTQPADRRDFASVSSMILADLEIKGREVKALMQAPSDGFFYVIDRATGKLISAKPYIKATRASKVATGGSVAPGSGDEARRTEVISGTGRARDWQPLSYNTSTGLVYILKREPSGPSRAPVASLLAWDAVHQNRAWEVALDSTWSPGTLTTAGNLVFAGRTDGVLYAYDASDGKVVWQYNLGLGIAAPPISYSIKGVQYIALLVGGRGFARGEGAITPDPGSQTDLQPRRLVAFSLQGAATLPAPPTPASASKQNF